MPTLGLYVDVFRFNLGVSMNVSSQVVFRYAPFILLEPLKCLVMLGCAQAPCGAGLL